MKEEFDGFKVYNEDRGIYVMAGVSVGDKKIISFDSDASHAVLSDGKNENKVEFGSWPKISKNRKWLKVEAKSEFLPAKGATELHLKGELHALVASKTATKSSAQKEFVKGDLINISDEFKPEISTLKESGQGMEMELKWKKKIPELAAVRFYDKDGKEIEADTNGGSSSTFGKRVRVSKSWRLKRKVKVHKLEFDLWQDAKNMTVPLDLKFGLSNGAAEKL